MTLQRRRVGIVGAGWVSAYHLVAWQRHTHRAEVVAIADPAAEVLATRADAFGIPGRYPDAASMFDAERLDAVDICTPRVFHVEQVRLAAARGLAVSCQKPLAPTLAQAEALVAGLPDGTRVMVHENWRFRPYYRRLKEWLEAGLAGPLRHVRFEFLSSGMIADAAGERPALVRQPFFRGQERLLVMEILIHHLDTLRFLLGEMDVVSARLERSNADIVAEDVASVVLRRRSDGVLVFVDANLAVHGAPPAPSDRLRVYGARGTIALDDGRLTARGTDFPARDETFDPDAAYQAAYDAAVAQFLDGLDGKPMETGPDDNLRTLALVEDVYRLGGFDPARAPL